MMSTGLTEVEKAVRERRSVRIYRDEPVPDELVERVMEAARWAPSAVNSQPWHFVVVREREGREFLSRHSRLLFVRNRHVADAPVVIILCGDPRRSRWFREDCTLAGANIMLVAHSLGLGTCWVGLFDAEPIKEYFGIPAHFEIVALITLGYPEEVPAPPPRLPLESIVHYEHFERARAPGIKELTTRSGPLTVLKRFLKMLLRKST